MLTNDLFAKISELERSNAALRARVAGLEAKDAAWRKAVEDFAASHIKVRHDYGDAGMESLRNLFGLLYGKALHGEVGE